MLRFLEWFGRSSRDHRRPERCGLTYRPLVGQLEDRQLLAVTYHGGPLIPNVQVESVFLGSIWQQAQASQASQLDNYFAWITNSPYMDMLGQYGVGRGRFLGADTVTSVPTGSSIAETQIQGVLSSEIHAGRLAAPSSNSLYVVFLPPTLTSEFDQQHRYVGHHAQFTDPVSGQLITYAVIPDQATADLPKGALPGSLTPYQQQTWVSSHELAEAVTDPNVGGGWWDSDVTSPTHNDEIGDIPPDTLPAGQVGAVLNNYVVQKIWSNFDGASIVQPGPPVYSLRPNGDVVRSSAAGTFLVLSHTGIVSTATNSQNGALYVLETSGRLDQFYAGAETLIDTGVVSFNMDSYGGGTLFILESSGQLKQDTAGTWSLLDTGVVSFTMNGYGGGTLFVLEANGQLKQDTAGTWSLLDSGVVSFTMNNYGGGTLFVLESNGQLKQDTAGTWALLDTGVVSFAMNGYGGGTLFILEANGQLKQDTAGTWALLDTGVKWFSSGRLGDTVDVLETNGTLKHYVGTSFTVVASNIQSCSIAPGLYGLGTIFARDNNGVVRQFPA
jgi:hypothetical protein